MSDDDEEREQIVLLEEFLDSIPDPEFSEADESFLNEAFYTLEENGRMEYRIDEELIPVIWKLFKAIENLSPVVLDREKEKFRM